MTDSLQSIEGERGIPSVNERRKSPVLRGLAFLLILVIGVAVAAFALNQARSNKEAASAAKTEEARSASSVPPRVFEPATPVPEPAEAEPAPALPVPVLSSRLKPEASGRPLAPSLPQSEGQSAMLPSVPALDKSGSSLLVTQARSADMPSDKPARPVAADTGNPSGIAGQLVSTRSAGRTATALANRSMVLPKGSTIDCALQTRLDSTVPGMTACVVTRNIYSENGKVLLIERGSTMTGEYQANMRQGMARIFVLWSRLKTTQGVLVDLDSPGADPLGGSGLPGHVDDHFWKRFGGSLMLSFVDDAARLATQGNNSTTVNLSSTTDTAQNMAAEALKSTINIPPTLTKNQGEQISIYVARDLDFSTVYRLETVDE